jgi:uncharacterized protein
LKQLDAWEFSRLGGHVACESKLGDFARLREVLRSDSMTTGNWADEPVSWAIKGVQTPQGACTLVLSGRFRAPVACLRCAEELICDMVIDRQLRLCKSEQEADSLETEDNEDAVAAPGKADAMQWLEDELLLCLPMFPAHEQCQDESSDPLAPDNTRVADANELAAPQTNGDNAQTDQQPAGSSPQNPVDERSVHRPFEMLSRLMKKPGGN